MPTSRRAGGAVPRARLHVRCAPAMICPSGQAWAHGGRRDGLRLSTRATAG